jgi:hypothetical protein
MVVTSSKKRLVALSEQELPERLDINASEQSLFVTGSDDENCVNEWYVRKL